MGLAKNHTIFRTHVVGNKDVVSMFGWLLVAFRTAAVKEASLGSSSSALKSSTSSTPKAWANGVL